MLNFKQFHSMATGPNLSLSREESFLKRAPLLGALCGILVWESEDGFVEKARFGFGEEGHFYEFMARGEGNLERLGQESEGLVFPKTSYRLFSPEAEFAVSCGIFREGRLAGFLVLEMQGDVQKALNKAFLLARFFDEREPSHSFSQPISGDPREFAAIRVLVESYPVLKQGLEALDAKNPVLIVGPPGSGKKSLVRFLHRRRRYPGNLLILNTIPDNLGKLERALKHWEELAMPQGVLVFDKIPNLTLGQQRIFYEWLEGTHFPGKIFFVDRNEKRTEIYQPFWALLEISCVPMPSLDSLPKPLLGEVIDAMFEEICYQSGRESLRLRSEAREKLRFSSYPGNLEELRNLLSNAIWRSRGLEVGLEDLDAETREQAPNLNLPTPDDLDLPKSIRALERQKILLAQKLFSGNQIRMAKALKISRGSLQYKMRNLGL